MPIRAVAVGYLPRARMLLPSRLTPFAWHPFSEGLDAAQPDPAGQKSRTCRSRADHAARELTYVLLPFRFTAKDQGVFGRIDGTATPRGTRGGGGTAVPRRLHSREVK